METLLNFQYYNAPSHTIPLHATSPVITTCRATNLHFSSRQHFSSARSSFGHVINPALVNRSSKPTGIDKGDNRINGRGKSSISYKSGINAVAQLGNPLDGRGKLNSLTDISLFLASSKGEPSDPAFKLSKRPSPSEIDQFKMEVVKQLREANEVMRELKRAYEEHKEDSEIGYNLGMALVEILISQGKFEEAFKCDCLKDDNHHFDPRRPLYKAIIFAMLNKHKEAKESWEEFAERCNVDPFRPTDIPLKD